MDYSLTNPQNSIWLTEKFYSGKSINNISGYTYISEEVDFKALNKAINEVVKTNDAMRIKIKEENNSCIQYFSEYSYFDIETIELSSEDKIEKKSLELAKIPFAIQNSNLFKFTLFKLPNNYGGFFLTAHHLIGDSWSLGLAVKQIMAFYSSIKNNTYEEKEHPSYTTYIEDEKKYLESDKFNKDKEYWNTIFKTVPEIATIPSLKKINTNSCDGNRLNFSIENNLVNNINEFCKKNRISLYNFFMSVYSLYLGRVSGSDDFVIGTPILNRTNFEQKNTMGMFISTAPLRINLNHEISFVDFIKEISTNTISLFRHQKYPYQYILEDLRKVDSSIPNLYNVVLSYQITKTFDEESGIKYRAEWLSNSCCADDLQIHLLDINDDGKIHVAYDYKTDKYDNKDIADLHARILTIINQVMSNNDIILKDIEIVTPEEKHQILYEFNNTKVDYPRDKTIVDLFEEQVEKTPDNIAVVSEDQKLTYRELNEKSNQLARYLLSIGINENDTIGLMLPKGIDFIISVLGILKIRGIYVPIYTQYPSDRINYMLSNSNAKLLITYDKYITDDISFTNTLLLNNSYTKFNALNRNNLDFEYLVNDIIYIIFTSGSTGTPKGVQILNKNLVNFLFSFNTYYEDISNEDNFLSSTNISFDVSIWEIFLPICFGGKLFFNNTDIIENIFDFCNQIITNNITALYIPPNILEDVYSILEKNNYTHINKLLVGVEPISTLTLNKYFTLNKNLIIVNGYGPTETTICATALKYFPENKETIIVPIGKPLNNNNVYILSSDMNLLPPGIPGELYVSGAGVGAGYIGNDEKNKQAFFSDPFNSSNTMYKTGDIAKWDSNGIISFVGRKDSQVKVSGYRIELNEINYQVMNNSNVEKSIVTVINNKDIACYYIAQSHIDINRLKNILKHKLPKYMIPKFYIELDSFPLNANGKIDFSKLPAPVYESNKVIHEPTNKIEDEILNILKKITTIENIDIYEDFNNLNFDSLDYIKISSQIYSKFNVSIPTNQIINNNSIRALADLIITSSSTLILKYEKMNYYPLTEVQTGIYYSCNLNNNSILYNTAGGIIVDKELDIEKLKNCFETLINRHEALRTHFELKDNSIVQIIDDKIDFNLNVKEADNDNINKIYKDFVRPFDLSKAPLFRAEVVCLKNNKMLLLLDMHHIISDGISLKILMQELCDLYNGKELSDKTIDYTDFCLWEQEQFKTEEFNNKREFWVNKFKDEVPLLNMPTTYPRPTMQSFEGKDYKVNLSQDIFNKINDVSKALNITPYMLMLSCYYILLSKYSSQNDIVVGSPIFGRELPELSNILGMFVNTLALRNTVDHSLSFEEFSTNIKNNCLEYFKNQSYSFDMLVKDLKIKRDPSRNPLFDTVFVYQNEGYPQLNINGVSAEYYTPEVTTSKFDLTLEVVPNNSEYTLRFEYCTKLFDKKFITRLSSHYINILNTILDNNQIKISDIDMLSTDEREKILYGFNNIEAPTNDDTFVTLFENQVKKYPNNIALICDNKSLTYSELNEKANSLAHFLLAHNVKQNDIIAIMTDRSLETIVCMLGILKAGAAFVNMDPTYPIERTTYYLNDCKAKCVLKQKHLDLPVKDFENIYEIDLDNDIYKENKTNPNIKINLDSLSYIIYTSGSTGVPKGVVLNQLGLANMCKAMTLVLDYLKDGPNHAILSVTSTPFDIFVYEITVSLSHGMRVVLANNAEHRDPKLVDMLIRKHGVDVMTVTPSLMKINYDNREPNSALAMVKNMVFGGEPLSEKFVSDLKSLSSDITIYNIYGPSEITVLCNVQNLEGEKEINIGPPILNNKIYVLDNDMNPLPIGLSGEIYIGGIQVGCGYLGKEDLTNEKFINNPFAPGKMFKSGDIGRWTEEGKLQCLGRIDHQIKLRGLRVELGEIEKLLEAIPEVDEAVVNKVTIDNKEALCAYYVLNSSIDEILLRNTLREKLPYYMVPTYFMKLDKMPYSINRKIDRKALPIPTSISTSNKRNIETVNSLSTTSDKLLFVWKNVLHTNDIDVNDNFFDVGGDSISAIQVQIEAVKLGINIEYSDIFKYPTIKQLSGNIKSNECYDLTKFNNDKINELLKNNTNDGLSTMRKAKFKNVLIVGTTGYLGIHLIHEFLTTCKGNAYCLIRPKNNMLPEQRLEDMFIFYFGKSNYEKYKKRIVILKGDITMDNLGLSMADLDLVKNKIDVIINSGALVKHYGTSKLFEDINVLGTQNIVNFCTQNNKRLLHISTISVSGNGERLEDDKNENLIKDTFAESDLYIGQQVNGIYTYTKFQAEHIVLNAIAENNLNAMIFRVGNITNRFSDGLFQRNFNDNAFAKRIKSFIEIGAFPDYFLEHELELSPVDLCAKAIIKALQYESNCNVLHIYNSHLLAIKTFIETLNELNIKLTPVSNKLMRDIITGILEDDERKEIVSGIIYDLDKNKNLVYTSSIKLNSDFSNKYLAKIGFYWKKTDKRYLKKCMKYFKEIGFIDF